MPDIGGPAELWDELLVVKLKFPANPEYYGHMERPLVVCHFQGDSSVLAKNYPDWAAHRFITKLLRADVMKHGEVVLLGRTDKGLDIKDHRVTKMRIADIHELANLLSAATLVVGIDSGVLHFTRFTDTPALGVWTSHAPWYFALPRELTRHLSQVQGSPARLSAFNASLCTSDDEHPETLVRMALEILS